MKGIKYKYVKDRLRQTHTTNRMRLQRYNLAQAMSNVFHCFFAYGHKKKSPKSFDSEDLDKRRQLPTLPHCIAVAPMVLQCNVGE